MIALDTMVVAGSGEAARARPDLFDARTRSTVRLADPAAWITAAAVANAIAGTTELLAKSLHQIGMVVVSDQGPSATMAEVDAAAKTGFSSPLRYAASSPGTLAGVSCIAFGFRGPTLNLSMNTEAGLPIGLQMCSGWLTGGAARWMVLATHKSGGLDTHLSRAVLLAHPDIYAHLDNPLTPSLTDWLSQART
jgi:hypothetical protein